MRSHSGARTTRASRGIGEILVSEGTITGQQLDEAYRLGRQQRQAVGKILLSLGHVKQSDLARALARKLGLEFIDLGFGDVDTDAVRLVDKKLLRRYGMLPLRVEDGRLVVAMRDPSNLHALEDLKLLSGFSVDPVVVAANDLRRVSDQLFGEGDEVADLLEEASAGPPAQDRDEVKLGGMPGRRGRRQLGWSAPFCGGRRATGPRMFTSSRAAQNWRCVSGWMAYSGRS